MKPHRQNRTARAVRFCIGLTQASPPHLPQCSKSGCWPKAGSGSDTPLIISGDAATKGSFDAPEPGLLQSLIQKQLQTDFPDQAAELQALQEVSSSVSTSDAVAVPMPEGIKLPSISGIGAAAKRAGLAIVSAPAALYQRGERMTHMTGLFGLCGKEQMPLWSG